MNLKSRCYLCLSNDNLYSDFICNICFHNLTKLKWMYCTRCGNDLCYGCDQLNEFKNINSLFSYSSGIPEILVLAKDKNDYNAKLLFKDMFFEITKKYLTEIIKKRNYNYIVFPTLRKERVLNSSWHPIIFFESIFKTIQKEQKEENFKFEFLRPLLLRKSLKQALIPSSKRSTYISNIKNQKLFLDKNKINKMKENNNCKILMLDDVLTTGKTAVLIKKMLEENIQGLEWDLFTLFRSIQKASLKND